MKKNKVNLIFLLFIFSFLGCNDENNIDEVNKKSINSSSFCYPQPNDKYQYPITPGMKEWKELKSIDEAFKICQLPDSILKSISTQGLIDALVHSPMFTGHYLLSSSTPIDTWHRQYSYLNSAKELFNRANSGTELIAYYKGIDLPCIDKISNSVDKATEFERLQGIEFLFTKTEILNKINRKQKQELIEVLLQNYDKINGREYSVNIMTSVMYQDNYAPLVNYYKKNIELYDLNIMQGVFIDKKQIDELIYFAEQFIILNK